MKEGAIVEHAFNRMKYKSHKMVRLY